MTPITYRISSTLFDAIPQYSRAIIWGYHVVNDESPHSLSHLLEEETFLPLNTTNLADHPRIAGWREAYTSLPGAVVGKDTSAFESAVDQVLRSHRLPLSTILQDIALLLSLWHLVPVMAHTLDVLQEGLALRPADGSESFTPRNIMQSVHPQPGEIVLVDQEMVLVRNWNQCEGSYAKITCETTAVVLSVDALPIIPVSELEGICEEAVSLLDHYCGGNAHYAILNQRNPVISLR